MLLDSGSNSILRPRALTDETKEVLVGLANDETVTMLQDTRTRSIVTQVSVQLIIPSIALYEHLGYLPRKRGSELWLSREGEHGKGSGYKILTDRGTTEIAMADGMKLIWELEGVMLGEREEGVSEETKVRTLNKEEKVIAEQLLAFFTKANPQDEPADKVEEKTEVEEKKDEKKETESEGSESDTE